MINVGITGQEGFIGQHLYNTLGLFPNEFKRVEYNLDFFADEEKLNHFAASCDVIVHLAALNRHNDPNIIYETNIALVNKLINALVKVDSRAHVLFSSSSQEELDNLYGKSKRDGRELFANWAKKSGGTFTGLVLPNVFGPFGNPHYNSFIATFCYQLSHNEQTKISIDNDVSLIYVDDVVKTIIEEIRTAIGKDVYIVPCTDQKKVSEILKLLENYNELYLNSGIIPDLRNEFEVKLFNTYRCYIDINNLFPVKYKQHIDVRGAFVEIIRLNVGGQVSFSTTVPGITRGNHFHTRKIERFSVIKGKALIQLRRIGTKDILDFYLSGDEPAYVDMPVWYTHNIKNIGKGDLYTIFWINEFYNPADPDTYFENV